MKRFELSKLIQINFWPEQNICTPPPQRSIRFQSIEFEEKIARAQGYSGLCMGIVVMTAVRYSQSGKQYIHVATCGLCADALRGSRESQSTVSKIWYPTIGLRDDNSKS